MQIHYDQKADLLYFRIDSRDQDLTNKRVSDGIVLDLGADDKIVGIEIMDASKRLELKNLLPVEFSK